MVRRQRKIERVEKQHSLAIESFSPSCRIPYYKKLFKEILVKNTTVRSLIQGMKRICMPRHKRAWRWKRSSQNKISPHQFLDPSIFFTNPLPKTNYQNQTLFSYKGIVFDHVCHGIGKVRRGSSDNKFHIFRITISEPTYLGLIMISVKSWDSFLTEYFLLI